MGAAPPLRSHRGLRETKDEAEQRKAPLASPGGSCRAATDEGAPVPAAADKLPGDEGRESAGTVLTDFLPTVPKGKEVVQNRPH